MEKRQNNLLSNGFLESADKITFFLHETQLSIHLPTLSVLTSGLVRTSFIFHAQWVHPLGKNDPVSRHIFLLCTQGVWMIKMYYTSKKKFCSFSESHRSLVKVIKMPQYFLSTLHSTVTDFAIFLPMIKYSLKFSPLILGLLTFFHTQKRSNF